MASDQQGRKRVPTMRIELQVIVPNILTCAKERMGDSRIPGINRCKHVKVSSPPIWPVALLLDRCLLRRPVTYRAY